MQEKWNAIRDALQLGPTEGAAEALTKLNLILSWIKSDVPTPAGTRLESVLAKMHWSGEEPLTNTTARHIVLAAIDVATAVAAEGATRNKALGSYALRVKT